MFMVEIHRAENGGFILRVPHEEFGASLSGVIKTTKEYVFLDLDKLVEKLKELFPKAV